jgi:hypothetical protein
MAQTNFTPISLYYSATSTNVPTAGNLVAGELAINTADGKLFYKDSAGVVQTLATKTAATFPNVNGSTSGAVTLAAPAVAGSNTATFPAATGTVMVSGNQPAFSAYLGSAQTITENTTTKIQYNTEEFDTANCYDPTTNYRFTPNVAGYYQVILAVEPSVSQSYQYAYIYKNGSPVKRNSSGSSVGTGTTCTAIIYMNGSTDYLEGYTLLPTTSALTASSQANYFQALLLRTA